jgi:hypothetical protein
MSTARVLVLFVIGLLLTLLVFPVAFFVSAALGYVFGVIALAIGVWLAVKRAGRTLPLVLGVVLVVIAVISIAGTAFIHMAAYSVSKAVETKHVFGVIGQAVTVGDWEITVLGVKEAKYLKRDDSYYAAKEGQKAVVVTLRIKNIGKETKTSDIWKFVIVTNANKSYERKSVYNFEPLWSWDVTEGVKRSAVTVNELETFASIAPGTQMEGDILFAIPQNEEPQRLHFKVGIITEVIVTLR